MSRRPSQVKGGLNEEKTPLMQAVNIISPALAVHQANVPVHYTASLWDGVLSDAAKEEWDHQCGRAPTRAPSATPVTAAPARHARVGSSVSARGGYGAAELTAVVTHKKRLCCVTFSKAKDTLKITRTAKKAGGKEKVILHVMMHAVLNIETPEERDRRQRVHSANDETTKEGLRDGKHPADRFACAPPAVIDDSETGAPVYNHSRANTLTSTSTAGGGYFTAAAAAGGGASLSHAVGPLASDAPQLPPTRYFIHYARVEGTGRKRSIHTVEVTVATGDAQHLAATFRLAKALLRRVYLCGPKCIIAFISPKSGTGQGEDMFRQTVMPFLHFSRHSVRVILTTRAHDAEDYAADLDHYLDDKYVLVAVGGDGMMHEVVNGLHRRKLLLAEIVRGECRRRVEAGHDKSPGSQANILNSIHMRIGGETDSDADPGGAVSGLASLSRRQQQQRREDSAPNRVPQGGNGSSAAALPGLFRGSSPTPTSTMISSPPMPPLPAGSPGAHSSARSSQFYPALSPSNMAHSRTTSGALVHHIRPVHGGTLSGQWQLGLPPRGGAVAEVSFAAHVTNIFLSRGWDGLIPMTATVPAGSACGLAKSLDVLSVTEAALALVHLAVAPEDLMLMRFAPNPEMIGYHRRRMKASKLEKAESKYEAYEGKYRSERGARARQVARYERDQRRTSSSAAGEEEGEGVDRRAGPLQMEETQQQLGADQRGGSNTNHNNSSSINYREAALSPSCASSSNASLSAVPPFLRDGASDYRDPVSMSIGAPEFPARIAFMSLSFGAANDIDRGSEHLRWMGNARFTVYGGYTIMRGITPYEATIRYLPWVSKDGLRVEKVHAQDRIPDASQMPRCTMKMDCPHCLHHLAPEPLRQASRARQQQRRQQAGDEDEEGEGVGEGEERRAQRAAAARQSSREFNAPSEDLLDVAVVAEATDAALLGEDTVDFDDESLPWVTIRGAIYNLLICNLRDVAQDMMMAPISHLADGAIDLVISRDPDYPNKGGGRRKEFIQFFGALEKGDHVNLWFADYVKATAVEVKVDGGISMADGEMMPLSTVRLTKLRAGNRLVRADL